MSHVTKIVSGPYPGTTIRPADAVDNNVVNALTDDIKDKVSDVKSAQVVPGSIDTRHVVTGMPLSGTGTNNWKQLTLATNDVDVTAATIVSGGVDYLLLGPVAVSGLNLGSVVLVVVNISVASSGSAAASDMVKCTVRLSVDGSYALPDGGSVTRQVSVGSDSIRPIDFAYAFEATASAHVIRVYVDSSASMATNFTLNGGGVFTNDTGSSMNVFSVLT